MAPGQQPSATCPKDSSGTSRKRTTKACDWCRLKKSKCDGSKPCYRCKSKNAICSFTAREKGQKSNYPEGYAEILEKQQAWLVSELQKLYQQALKAECWQDRPLFRNNNGYESTHDLLGRLGVPNCSRGEQFQEKIGPLQQKLCLENDHQARTQNLTDKGSGNAESPLFPSPFSNLSTQPTLEMFNEPISFQEPMMSTFGELAQMDPIFLGSMIMTIPRPPFNPCPANFA
ncbi:Zn(II)2Cys6 transcription factor domain-containing protein [Aspergillus homomorphus CBS 101889]|uniref:Zn(2)-C6 fungal-type domain-containing protein n=1 Tax=Aspergillus homomorphus (strain CBS 101889) TaxID=1450537 RepID=A0A395I1Q1_ASPHC|nr:hypothetical protein BO97DRAFT_388844 [Aspergillus homomorphus CBS 101889]RAL13098.1 hypothetical protein BO97DRAFT_388844 [Aspergillus homomorphus CBS 101889]